MSRRMRTDRMRARAAAVRSAAGLRADIAGVATVRHFSPGYDGEKPNHFGPQTNCAFQTCREAATTRIDPNGANEQ